MAQAEKTGAKTGTKGTDVPDVPSARFTAGNSTFRVLRIESLRLPPRKPWNVPRNPKSETGGHKFQKVLNPNRQMNRRSTVGFSPCGGAATGQGRCVNSATVRCPQDGRGRRHLGARSLQRERGRWRGHGEARRDLISARLERLHQALDVASETGQIPAVRLERVAALVVEDPKLRYELVNVYDSTKNLSARSE